MATSGAALETGPRTYPMPKDRIQYDENGNFVFDAELEVQWMKLHRDIQSEYRVEQFVAFLKGAACAAVVTGSFYLALTSFNNWFY